MIEVDGITVRRVIQIFEIVFFRLLAHVTGPASKEGAAVIRQRRACVQEGQCTSWFNSKIGSNKASTMSNTMPPITRIMAGPKMLTAVFTMPSMSRS